jgi:outer membrane protein assembly factor BamB
MKASVVLIVLLPLTAAWAADWPQWRGPDRNGVSKETGLLPSWPIGGPKLLWTSRDAGRGFGGPAVVGERVYVLGALGGAEPLEHVIALDAAGKKLWATPIAKAYDFRGNVWSLGPNSTPAVDGHSIFALGSQGMFVCVDDTGKEKWRKDLVKEMGGRVNPVTGSDMGWGFNWSPLVAGDLVIIAPGGDDGLLAALDKNTGAVVWRSKAVADECTYSSPVLATIDGVPQLVYAAQAKVCGVALKDGALLWSYEKKRQAEEIVAATPIVHDGRVLVSGSAAGTELFKVSKSGSAFTAETVWDTKTFANLHGGMVLVGGNVYGAHETRAWKCFDFATGKDDWEAARPGPGAITCADGRLYCVSQDDGNVSLADASPAGLHLTGQFTLPEQSKLRRSNAKLWTHPVVANGRLYLRDQELLFCYAVKRGG